MIRLYYCHPKGDERGLYIISSSSKGAVHRFSRARHIPHYKIDAERVDIDIDPDESECIVYPGSVTADIYGISYSRREAQRRGGDR